VWLPSIEGRDECLAGLSPFAGTLHHGHHRSEHILDAMLQLKHERGFASRLRHS
jgi:hypothetical protein